MAGKGKPPSLPLPCWLFTSVAKDLNSGRPRTNPASGLSGTDDDDDDDDDDEV